MFYAKCVLQTACEGFVTHGRSRSRTYVLCSHWIHLEGADRGYSDVSGCIGNMQASSMLCMKVKHMSRVAIKKLAFRYLVIGI